MNWGKPKSPPTPPTKEEFMTCAKHVLDFTLEILVKTLDEGKDPNGIVPDPQSFISQIYEMATAEQLLKIDVSNQVKASEFPTLGGRVLVANMLVKNSEVVYGYIKGYENAPMEEIARANKIITDVLVNEHGMDRQSVEDLVGMSGVPAAQQWINEAMTAQVDSEVEAFRADLEANLDTLFGGGDNSA